MLNQINIRYWSQKLDQVFTLVTFGKQNVANSNLISMQLLMQQFEEDYESKLQFQDDWGPDSDFQKIAQNLPLTQGNSEQGLFLSKVSLISLGLLMCNGTIDEKSEVFYDLVLDGRHY